jgi:hypothetical protein
MFMVIALSSALLSAAAPVSAATPIGNWPLKGNVANKVTSPLVMSRIGATSWVVDDVNGTDRKVLAFDAGEGLTISGIPAAARRGYTIEVLLKADELDSYWRIQSFGPNDVDEGLYLYGYGNGENSIYLYDELESDALDAVQDDTWVRVRVTRSAATKVMRVYVNGVQVIRVKDEGDLYRLRMGRVVFFQDDGDEHGFGRAAGVRVWQGVVAP